MCVCVGGGCIISPSSLLTAGIPSPKSEVMRTAIMALNLKNKGINRNKVSTGSTSDTCRRVEGGGVSRLSLEEAVVSHKIRLILDADVS